MDSLPGAYVTLARILRPRGRKGEVAAQILTDFPERLTRLREVWLVGPAPPSGPAPAERRIRVRACWISPSRGGQAIFHFEGYDSISQAEELRGLEVQVPLKERAPLPAGRHYIGDLVGCEVWERLPGGQASSDSRPLERLGTVRDVQSTGGAASLLVVESAAGEVLIPMVAEFCVLVDPVARRIEVVLPQGLRELNR
ncbi:MAG TPA: ribosome maturation factor RimM [Candidatus Acidoferrales bacterium]|nr:ribosome maturation factor RimM [Candidatus Acidoferrales bacterium]